MPHNTKPLLIKSSTEYHIRLDGSPHRSRSGSNTSIRSNRRTSLNNNYRPSPATVALETTLAEAALLIVDGLSHRTSECVERYLNRPDDPHHALFGAIFESLDELCSLNKPTMLATLKKVKHATDLANKKRAKHRVQWSTWLSKHDYDSYTEEEIHAELIYADSMIVQAAITALADQSIMGFINAALCARSAHNSYQECYNILKYRKLWTSQISRRHFENGVRLAIGGFDLFISYLPPRFIKLLEFAGFSGNRQRGLQEIYASEAISDALRWPVSALLVGLYHLVLELVFGLGEADIRSLEYLIVKAENKYLKECTTPSGYFMSVRAFYELNLGNLDTAVAKFKEVTLLEYIPQTIKDICYVANLWANTLLCNWSEAAHYAKYLMSNQWSPACVMYLYAANLAMVMDEEKRPELRDEISECLKKVPSLKRSFGGKRAFHERLVLGRAKEFADCPELLLFAPLEVGYMFNFVNWINGRKELTEPILARIDAKLKELEITTEVNATFNDQLAHLLFLRGVFARLGQNYQLAKSMFEQVYELRDKLIRDVHLGALAAFELGMCYRSRQQFDVATEWFHKAKHDFGGHYAEAMVNYRTDLALESMKNSRRKSAEEPCAKKGLIGSFLIRRSSSIDQTR